MYCFPPVWWKTAFQRNAFLPSLEPASSLQFFQDRLPYTMSFKGRTKTEEIPFASYPDCFCTHIALAHYIQRLTRKERLETQQVFHIFGPVRGRSGRVSWVVVARSVFEFGWFAILLDILIYALLCLNSSNVFLIWNTCRFIHRNNFAQLSRTERLLFFGSCFGGRRR